MLVVAAPAAPAAYRGLNLPSQHADTNQGNFLPGVFAYKSYSIDRIVAANFSALRLCINVETARDRATLKTLRGYVDALGTAAEPGILICMWDTLRPNETGHGDGLVNDVTEMTIPRSAAAQLLLGGKMPAAKAAAYAVPESPRSGGARERLHESALHESPAIVMPPHVPLPQTGAMSAAAQLLFGKRQ